MLKNARNIHQHFEYISLWLNSVTFWKVMRTPHYGWKNFRRIKSFNRKGVTENPDQVAVKIMIVFERKVFSWSSSKRTHPISPHHFLQPFLTNDNLVTQHYILWNYLVLHIRQTEKFSPKIVPGLIINNSDFCLFLKSSSYLRVWILTILRQQSKKYSMIYAHSCHRPSHEQLKEVFTSHRAMKWMRLWKSLEAFKIIFQSRSTDIKQFTFTK